MREVVPGKKEKETTNKNGNGKELVCVFLGVELYTTKKAANLLKTEVIDLLKTDIKEIPILAVKAHTPVELTPTLTNSWDKIKLLLTQPTATKKSKKTEK